MKLFRIKILISICLWKFISINSETIQTNALANITVIPHTWHPTLFLAFTVNATELQLYIDPQLLIYKPFADDTAYLLFSLSKTTTPDQPPTIGAEISTVIMYKDKLSKSSLHLHFNSLLPVQYGPLYSPVPYGYTFAEDMSISLNKNDHTYHFNINDGQIQLNTLITWSPNEEIDVNSIETSLASVLLNPSVNKEYIESLYKYNEPTFPSMPILHGLQQNYQYDKPLHPCSVNTFISTYIEKTVGQMKTLNNYPVLCAFTLQRSSNVTPASQINEIFTIPKDEF